MCLAFTRKSTADRSVIKLSRQLHLEAQEQAIAMRGYDEDHVSILSNKDVMKQLYEILDANSR